MDEDTKILAEDLVDCLSGIEASIIKFKMMTSKLLGDKKSNVELPFKAEAIKWQQRQNQKGLFELSENYDSEDHKALLKFLNDAGGCLASEGWFYWIFPDFKTVGRKRNEFRKKGIVK